MSFLKRGTPWLELSSSFTIISAGHLLTQGHKDKVSIHMFYKWIYGMKKTGQKWVFTFLKFNFSVLWRLKALLDFSFYLEGFKLEKKIENLNAGLQEEKKNGETSLNILTQPNGSCVLN